MKKIFYSITTATLLLGMTACGGNKSNEEGNNQATDFELLADDNGEFNEDNADENMPVDEDEDKSCESADSSLLDSTETEEFLANAKSGDIDRMLDAYEWYNNAKSNNREKVRAIDRTAIIIAVELDKLDEEAGKEYDSYGGLSSVLSSKTNEMSNEQLTRYNNISRCLYFTADDRELSDKFNEIYREIRYGI
ncbi:MAG: hypothetical protein K2G06_08505 [Muribaculaceae bacterium]|nr:hypothetical protein [Muribaculaceae bacterium]